MEFAEFFELLPESEARTRVKAALEAGDSAAFTTALQELNEKGDLSEPLTRALIAFVHHFGLDVGFTQKTTSTEEELEILQYLREEVDPKYHHILEDLEKFFQLPDGADVEAIPDIDDLIEAYPEEPRLYRVAACLAKSLTYE